MPNRLRLFVLLCLLSLPALSLAGGFASKAPAAKRAAVPPAPRSLALVKADVVGFWSYHDEFGLDEIYTIEAFFGNDGAFELRAYSESEGDTQTLHGFGTWKVENGEIVTHPDVNHCVSGGTVPADCADTASDFLAIDTLDGVKSLINTDGGDIVGEYAGSAKEFTLPDLFSISLLNAFAPRNVSSGRSLDFGSGTGSTSEGASGRIFDAMGRLPGGRAAGMRIRTMEKP